MSIMNDPSQCVDTRVGPLRRIAIALSLGLAMLGAMSPGVMAQDRSASVDLAPKLERGQTWRFRYHISSEMDFVIVGQKHAMSLVKEVVVRTKVINADDSGAQVELVHEEVRLRANGEVPGSFDSTKPSKNDADDVYAHILRPLVGLTLTLNVDKDGTIRSVSGLDSIQPADMMEAMLFKSLFGEDEFIRMYQPLFSLKPGDPKAERGESWNVKRRQASGLGILESNLRLTLERASRHDATIRIGGTESILPASGASGKVSDSSVKGTCVWDLDDGVLRELKTQSTTKFSPDSANTNGTEVSGEARATTELERLNSSGR